MHAVPLAPASEESLLLAANSGATSQVTAVNDAELVESQCAANKECGTPLAVEDATERDLLCVTCCITVLRNQSSVAPCEPNTTLIGEAIAPPPRVREEVSRAASSDLPMLAGCKYIRCSQQRDNDQLGNVLSDCLVVPSEPCIFASFAPLCNLPFVFPLICRYPRRWTVFFCFSVCCLNGMGMLLQWSPEYEGLTWVTTAVLVLMALIYASQVSCYNRNLYRQIVQTFEFWFVMGHMTIVTAGFAYGDVVTRNWLTLLLRVLVDALQALCLFGVDASFFQRKVKSFLMLVMAITWLAWVMILQFMEREGFDQSINIFGMKSIGIRETVTSSCFTIFVFNLKYAFVSFVLKSDVIMLQFSPRRVPNPVYDDSRYDSEMLDVTNYRFV